MLESINKICRAHGGIANWEKIERLSCKAFIHGLLFDLRRQPDIFKDVAVEIQCHTQHTIYSPCPDVNQRAVYTPDQVQIYEDAKVVCGRAHPRQHFSDRSSKQPWDELDAVYFGGYAIWHYLTAPFLFLQPGVELRDGDEWGEGDQIWSRLHVNFPNNIHSNCKEQTYYYDETGLLRRMDYHVEIVDSSIGVAHYMYDYVEVNGLMFPTRRCAFPRDSRGVHDPNMLLVELRLSEFAARPFLVDA